MSLKTEVDMKGSQTTVKQEWSDLAPRFRGKPFSTAICNAVALSSLTMAIVLSLAFATAAQELPRDLSKLSVEDLMNVEVTSVSKKEQKLSRVAAAIFVITAEDIRRSGATNVPDLLRPASGADK